MFIVLLPVQDGQCYFCFAQAEVYSIETAITVFPCL